MYDKVVINKHVQCSKVINDKLLHHESEIAKIACNKIVFVHLLKIVSTNFHLIK